MPCSACHIVASPASATKSMNSGRESLSASYSASLARWTPRSHRRIADRGLICFLSLPTSSTLTIGCADRAASGVLAEQQLELLQDLLWRLVSDALLDAASGAQSLAHQLEECSLREPVQRLCCDTHLGRAMSAKSAQSHRKRWQFPKPMSSQLPRHYQGLRLQLTMPGPEPRQGGLWLA